MSRIRSKTALGIPLEGVTTQNRQKIIVFGAHPGDPEAGCGGLVALLTKAGHDVVFAYLTRGEAGVDGATHDEAAAIRTDEAAKSCAMLKTRSHFMGQIDGDTIIDNKEFKKVLEFLESEQPDVLLTHWPIDTHLDHRICAALAYDAWHYTQNKPELYYYEVTPGGQTQNFLPSDFVDISTVVYLKREACYLHKSQKMREHYPRDHEKMEIFRGMESGYELAESYVRHRRNP